MIRSPELNRVRVGSAVAVIAVLSAAVAAWAQAPLSPAPVPKPVAGAAPVPSRPTVVASAPVPNPPARVRKARPLPASGVVSSANDAARSYPNSSSYINSTLFYDYEAGRLYQIQTSPHFLTAIMLRPGEKLLSKAAGDTVRWVLGETEQGSGVAAQVVVLVKPIRGGLRTNLVLTTDQRTYLIEAASRESPTYTSAVSWTYPQEEMRALAAQQAAEAQKQAASVAPALAIDQLHFDYKVEAKKGRPNWQPLRVFDDGAKTYIQFPVNMAATDAPPLFLLGPKNSAELVNYRYINGYYVVDRLIDTAELRLGEKPQTVVRITRIGVRG